MRALNLALVVLLAIMRVPAAGGNKCRDELLAQPVFASLDLLPQLHPAKIILQNFAIGSCNADKYREEKQDALESIAATKSTIMLLGGESTIDLPADDNGTCTDPAVQDCTDRYSADLFKSLADDPLATIVTYDNGNTHLPQMFNARFFSSAFPNKIYPC